MRKLLLLSVVLAALMVACENKSPTGPSGVGPGGVITTQTTSTTTSTTSTTTTTSIPASTSSSTSTTSTTTTVVASLSRRYVAFQPPPNVPNDMTLFFQLLTSGIMPAVAGRLPFLVGDPSPDAENVYQVTGVYTMLNGTTGTVEGDLGHTLNPLETGGDFNGKLTAKVGSCTAAREYLGPLGPQTLTWRAGNGLGDCPGSPLSFDTFTLVRGDAPLPSTTSTSTSSTTTAPTSSTTSSTSTTTTTTTMPATTTSMPACTYTLSPASAQVPATATSGQVVIGTLAACPWTAQSFAAWLTVTPASGSGAASVQYTATANTGQASRTGTLVIAGVTFTVTQAGAVTTTTTSSSTTSSSTSSTSSTSSSTSSTSSTTTTTIILGLGPNKKRPA